MNVSELARQLNTTTQELYDMLPQFGFDIGRHAIKVDDRVARKIMDIWPRKLREWRQLEAASKTAQDTRANAAEIAATRPPVTVPSAITVRDFSSKLNLPVTTVIRELVKNGILASLNERIDYDTASIIAGDLGFRVQLEDVKANEEEKNSASVDRLQNILDGEAKENLLPRPSVVVVMGHVDHGKTRLLDAIRNTNVMGGEAGGITQHIGAYQVVVKHKETGEMCKLTFIDTPGHEAFTVMRSRGAKVADIAILVVAADDGVQPQTREAIKIIQAAKLPFIVALNKIDKPEADLQRTKTQLAELGLNSEEWGGKTIMVPVAAKAGTNIDKLLEMLTLVADMEKDNIRSNPSRRAIGTIVEAHVDEQAGPMATLLVQSGTLHVNESLMIEGALYGRVRAMMDWTGARVLSAPPSMPVQILGFKVAPAVGDVLEVPESTKGLERKLKPSYLAQEKSIATMSSTGSSSANSNTSDESKEKKFYKLVIKVDVLGSLEAILGSLERMVHPEVGVEIVGKGLGTITEAEILRAEATGAVIMGFHVPILPQAERLAKEKKIIIKHYKIIYDLLGDVKKELEKMLEPEVLVEELGQLEVLAIFCTEKKYLIVGGKVTRGKVENNTKIRIMRAGQPAGTGQIIELKAGKQVVKDVLQGQEAGLKLQIKDKIEVGDILEVYREEIRQKKLGF